MTALTVVTVTLTPSVTLVRCLSSLAAQTFDDFDVVVVFNGSRSIRLQGFNSPELASKTRFIVNNVNQGYGAACNIGCRLSKARFVVFLNDDTVLHKECLADLYRSLSAERDSIFQPLIFHQYARQARVGNPCDIYGAAGIGFYGNCGTREFYASGACLAMDRNLFDLLGGFDDKLFLYHEDVDLSWRARLMGFRISATTTAICYHLGGSSASKPTPVKFYFTQRNRIRVIIKNYSRRRVATRLPIALSLIMGGAFFLTLRTRMIQYILSASRAFMWNLIMLSDTLTERYTIQKMRVQGDDIVENSMSKSSMDICVLKRHIK